MARGRVWSTLSPAYRARLEKGGITKAQYEAGASLSAARGHRETPEHPSEAVKKPGKFQSYNQRKDALIQAIQAYKDIQAGSAEKYDKQRSDDYVRYVTDKNGKVTKIERSITQLRRIAALMASGIVQEIAARGAVDDDARAFWYH